MQRFLASAILLACAGFTGIGYAQNENQSRPSTPDRAAQAQAPQSDRSTVSITGCLTKGADSGAYVITDQKTGEKYPFSGPPQLDKFVNQTVTLSGSMSTQGGEKAFRPERIAPVSTTCEKGQ